MVFGLGSCRALTRNHLTECSSTKLRPKIYLSSVMKHLPKAMACDAFGEERQEPQKRRRTTSGPKPKLFDWKSGAPEGTILELFWESLCQVCNGLVVPWNWVSRCHLIQLGTSGGNESLTNWRIVACCARESAPWQEHFVNTHRARDG